MQLYKPRYHSLDAWRGIACLSVIACHALFYVQDLRGSLLLRAVRYGWLGVPLFFVISGYCIAASASRPGAARDFVLRRFRRIYPTYWTVVAGVSLLLAVLAVCGLDWLYAGYPQPINRPFDLHLSQWIGNLGLWESWRPYLFGAETRYALEPAWTLCYEEQFYAITALVLWLARPRMYAVFGFITAGVFALQIAAWQWHQSTHGFFFDGHWLAFWAGVLVFQYRCHAGPALRKGIVALLGVLGALPFVLPGAFQQNFKLPLGTLVAAAFALLLLALSPWDEELAAHPVTRALSWCGVRCFSIYLLHWPITKIVSHLAWLGGLRSELLTLGVTLPLSILGSLLISGWFYRKVESRFLSQAR
jgi:peptidoglycan/LPS O-acetylase OafA/YrhL